MYFYLMFSWCSQSLYLVSSVKLSRLSQDLIMILNKGEKISEAAPQIFLDLKVFHH